MSDEESTPRTKRRRRPAAAKAPEEKASGTPRGRAAKKIPDTPATTDKRKRNEQGETSSAMLESDQEETAPKGRAAKKQPEKALSKRDKKKQEEEEKELAKSLEKSDSEEVEIVKTVKPRRGTAPVVQVKEEVEENEEANVSGSDDSDKEDDAPTSSKTPSKSTVKAKAAAAVSSSKPTRVRRAAGGGDKEAAAGRDESANKEKRGRGAKKGQKVVTTEESDEEGEEERPAARSTKKDKNKKKVVDSDDEEEEDERPTARKTRKDKKTVVASDEEDDGIPSIFKKRKDKKIAVDSDEDEDERPAARTTRKDKKKVVEHIDEEGDDDDDDSRPVIRMTRTEKRRVEEEEKAKKAAALSTRKGRKVDVEREEEEKRESPRKKARIADAAPEKKEQEGSSHSRARRRLDYDGEKEGESSKRGEEERKKKGGEKELRKVDNSKKKKNMREQSRRSDDERRGGEESDEPMSSVYDDEEEEEVKSLMKSKPSVVNDLNKPAKNGMSGRSSDHGGPPSSSISSSDSSDDSSDESGESSVVEGTKGDKAGSLDEEKLHDAKRSICVNIREALSATYASKDPRAFDRTVHMICKTKEKAYDRKDYEPTATCFYDEIENQLTNMMIKEDKETKAEIESKQGVLRAIAKSFALEFLAEPGEHDAHWGQINYLMNKFACAEDPHIRSFFCYWIGALQTYSKEVHYERYATHSRAQLEKMHERRRKDLEDYDDIDEDRRLIDGHVFKLQARRQLYGVLYTSLKQDEIDVRISAIRALSIIQDDPIPPNHIEAMKQSPKDLIMKQLLDIHINVRRAAMEELRPSTDQQIEILLHAARNEKHEKERILAFTQLGRLPVGRFNLEQRHLLLAMIRDNRLGLTVENCILRSWLFEMVTGENPRPIIVPEVKDGVKGERTKRKERMNDDDLKEKWMASPLQLLRYLDCVNYSDDVLEVLRVGSAIARKESGMKTSSIASFINHVIEACVREDLSMITMGDYNHLLDRDVSDEARALIVTFWLHSLQFIKEKARNEAEELEAVTKLSPSMGDLRELITKLLDDERERLAPRKEMVDNGDVDPTHPAFLRSSDKLLSIVTNLLTAFRFLRHGDTDGMREWRGLLVDLTHGHLIDVSPALWEVIMHDLLEFHCTPEQRDDLIYEVAVGMGFNFDDAIRRGKETGEGKRAREKGGEKSPRKTSPSKRPRTPTKSTSMANDDAATPASSTEDVKKREEEEKKMEERKFVLSRPPCLGMVHGALKTAFFKEATESIDIVFRSEVEAFRSIVDPRVRATLLECIGMLGIYSEEVADRYIGLVMESVIKKTPEYALDDMQDGENDVARGRRDEEEERKKRRNRKMKIINPDELEKDYERREKEDRQRREAERRRRRGGKDNCRGLALIVITDFIVAHSFDKVEQWLSKCEEHYSVLAFFTYLEALSQEADFELVFKVLHSTCKLALHDKELMKYMNKTMAQLQFRAFHPTSFSHSHFRACALGFTPLFGSKSVTNQMALTEVVITMLSMLKDTAIEYRNLIDRGGNASRAISHVVWSCAPSSLKLPATGIRAQNTAHGVLLRKLGQNMETCGEEARSDVTIDIEYYKALLDAVAGIELSGQTASGLRSIYDVLFTNMDLVAHSDKAGEARKKAVRMVKVVEKGLDTVNEIIRQNKALGVNLTDMEVRLPFEDEESKVFDELRKKADEKGMDLNAASPIKDGRPSSRLPGSAMRGTPITTKKRPGARGFESERKTGLMKKEPARSKSYAAAAAAERKEAAAASSSSTTQMTPRTSTRAHLTRKRPTRMETIEESGDSSD
ncbi:hypothetical protein PFISCL1PPCAC_823 [Pristionchus fissidentatus]|uniref:Nuclear condensin complex subunit 3 C-terminal domain-containing protein n=1 Tax=Pristionchus fissidentatus TaxID=1538716 RepID=A0AAV5UQY1_9BILA|nr:hypothetical protein PFISCL1PPCAC_823 [Pristionchus fissidentatus]